MQVRDRPAEPHSVQDTLFGPPSIADVSLSSQIACLNRELDYRERCYPRWVAGGRMTQAIADREVLMMQAALHTIETVKENSE